MSAGTGSANTVLDNLLDSILLATDFSSGQMLFAFICCFVAGVVRGFSGFALSALIMSSLVVILPPIQLLPICFAMETLAGLMMLRSGFKNANVGTVAWLLLGSMIGVPIGAYATVHLPVDVSKMIVLTLIITLAAGQLFTSVPKLSTSRTSIIATGLAAGVATGLAHVGGMIIALYVLAQNLTPSASRATLVLFLFGGTLTTGISLFAFDIFSAQSLWRSLALAPAIAVGVLMGGLLFNPALQLHYRKFCLALVIGIALASLAGSLFAHT